MGASVVTRRSSVVPYNWVPIIEFFSYHFNDVTVLYDNTPNRICVVL